MALGWVVLLPAALVWVATVTVLAGTGKLFTGFVFDGTGWFRVLAAVVLLVAAVVYRRRRGKA